MAARFNTLREAAFTPQAFYLKVIIAKPGGRFTAGSPTRFNSRESALREARRMQARFDEGCEPRRCYVFDEHDVALVAA